MNVPETFYIALCVTILMLGIVYWFWTQVQYLQRKVNLLDNVVYEVKTLITNLPGNTQQQGPVISEEPLINDAFDANEIHNINTNNEVPTAYNPPPESVAGDLEAERMASEIEFEPFSGAGESSVNNTVSEYMPPEDDKRNGSTSLETIREMNETSSYSGGNEGSGGNGGSGGSEIDELQPGGLASASSASTSDIKKVAAFSDSSIESPLSSMSIKDLRRMGEANNIPGSADLRKKDLIRALREKVGQIIGTEKTEKTSVLSFDDIGAPNSD